MYLTLFVSDFGDGGCAGQGSIQTRPPGDQFSYLPKSVFLSSDHWDYE